ncbi:MAG: thioredoxin [Sediminibacterium sp.]|jgi:thioredoxin 1|nr:thioredoxin [Sediminibacterium sp.]
MIQYLNEESFDESIKLNNVVLVDFYADWCGPCKLLHPILEQTAEKIGNKAVVAKVNVDTNPNLASRYGVRSIPALFYLKNGEVVYNSTGLVQSKEIVQKLEDLVL